MRVAFTAVLAALLTAIACAASTPAAIATGLRGTVMRGPTVPVCRVGLPCTAPAPGVVLVFRAPGRTVRARTDAHGRYRVELAAGSWAVALTRTGIGTALMPAHVRVVAGRMRTVGLSIDTGIR